MGGASARGRPARDRRAVTSTMPLTSPLGHTRYGGERSPHLGPEDPVGLSVQVGDVVGDAAVPQELNDELPAQSHLRAFTEGSTPSSLFLARRDGAPNPLAVVKETRASRRLQTWVTLIVSPGIRKLWPASPAFEVLE